MECGSLLPLGCARRRTVGRKRASGQQGGSLAVVLHSDACDFDGAVCRQRMMMKQDESCDKVLALKAEQRCILKMLRRVFPS
jgi:hypothetical protein